MSARVSRENPWPGLEAYEEADADLFFGREAEKTALRRLVQQNPLAIVYGISGLGKTSLLQAGLFPLLRADDFLPILLRLGRQGAAAGGAMEAGAGPTYADALVRQVRSQTEKIGGRAPEPCREGGTLWEYFHRSKSQFWSARTRLLTPVLVLDQFEEFFIAEGKSDAEHAATEHFFAELADLVYCRRPDEVVQRLESGSASPDSYVFGQVPLRVVISMREDFLPQLSQMGRRRFPTLLDAMFRLRPLGTEAARACIVGPAPDLFEPDAVGPLVQFLANAEKTAEEDPAASGSSSNKWVEPALLSIVCRELNERRGQRKISADLLKGSQNQILADFYERSWDGVAPELRRYVESNLVTQGGFRQALAVEGALEQPGVTSEDIDTLVERRILHYQDRQEGPRCIELTHDLLCRVALASRNAREVAERESQARDEARKAEERAAAAEAARMEEEKRRLRTRRVAWFAAAVAILVFVLFIYGLHETKTAREAAATAREAAATAREATASAQRAQGDATEIFRTVQARLRLAYARKHDLELVADIDQHVVDLLQQMYKDRPTDINGQSEIADYFDQVADAQFAMEHFPEATLNYQAAFDIRSNIAKTQPSDQAIQASLADSYDNLGQMDVTAAAELDPDTMGANIRGNLEKAGADFNTALSVRKKIPDQAGLGQSSQKEGIARSYELIGDADEAEAAEDSKNAGHSLGDAGRSAITKEFEDALADHRKAFSIVQADDAAAPGAPEHDIQLSAEGKIEDFIGNDQEQEGLFDRDNNEPVDANNKLMDALRAFGEAYKIRDRLCREDSGNTANTLYAVGNNLEWADDLSESADHIGDVYKELKDSDAQNRGLSANLEMALAWHKMCIEIKQALVNKDPSNAEWQAELSSSYDHTAEIATAIAEAAKDAGKKDDAMKAYTVALDNYEKSLKIDVSRALLDPQNIHVKRDEGKSYGQVADVLKAENNLEPLNAAQTQLLSDFTKEGSKILNSLRENAVDNDEATHDVVRAFQH